jgi:hypothetical protein
MSASSRSSPRREKVRGTKALRVQNGSEPKLLALPTWEEAEQALLQPASGVSVESLPSAEAASVVSSRSLDQFS